MTAFIAITTIWAFTTDLELRKTKSSPLTARDQFSRKTNAPHPAPPGARPPQLAARGRMGASAPRGKGGRQSCRGGLEPRGGRVRALACGRGPEVRGKKDDLFSRTVYNRKVRGEKQGPLPTRPGGAGKVWTARNVRSHSFGRSSGAAGGNGRATRPHAEPRRPVGREGPRASPEKGRPRACTCHPLQGVRAPGGGSRDSGVRAPRPGRAFRAEAERRPPTPRAAPKHPIPPRARELPAEARARTAARGAPAGAGGGGAQAEGLRPALTCLLPPARRGGATLRLDPTVRLNQAPGGGGGGRTGEAGRRAEKAQPPRPNPAPPVPGAPPQGRRRRRPLAHEPAFRSCSSPAIPGVQSGRLKPRQLRDHHWLGFAYTRVLIGRREFRDPPPALKFR
ncbi:translation initiation factor IF-2-like [Choloepus didactylus]|uniref:translation initiation factor IF-2-like n=1 Tax=Choloepus didactylus TaxID=27675 RepID=UPI00189C81D4|nr:translation initiation factor IF-2-like [Choloepus didactylus]